MASKGKGTAGLTIAQLLLRTALGGTLVAHGIKHGRTLEGTGNWFRAIGFQSPKLQARTSSLIEIGSGVAIAAGAVMPVGAAAVVGTMGVAARSVHLPNGFFITSEGWEYVMNLSVATVALAALGAGPCSVDRLLGVDRKLTGVKAAGVAAGLGLAGAAAHLAVFYRRPAHSSPKTSQ
ncbi:DoxX family protein [Rhodococcus sp. NPDC059968]|uniref:DoxX family protein n=1 Tax=Rhodococcus sp. NPDC059968 TaxID=3347017 RepID=UPI0036703227